MAIDVDKAVFDSYFGNPELVRYLLIENLILKTILHEKGLMTLEEFEICKKRATELFDQKSKDQMLNWKHQNESLLNALVAPTPKAS